MTNLVTGNTFTLHDSVDLRLSFSRSKDRVAIPWWHYWHGDDVRTASSTEEGFGKGFHLEGYSGEEEWDKISTLLLFDSYKVLSPAWSDRVSDRSGVFDGYGWFRQQFDLPLDAVGESIVFCLGGYNQEDWAEYWVYLNGTLVDNWQGSGRWRSPHQIALEPGTPEHDTLRFGADSKNQLAIRTRAFDKGFKGVSDGALDRWRHDGRIVDQFISVGEPYLQVENFNVDSWREEENGSGTHVVFELTSPDVDVRVALHYQLDGFTRRKWCEITNIGKDNLVLLDISLDDFTVESIVSDGDLGFPVFIADEMYCGIEHPAGLNQGITGEGPTSRVVLQHFPGVQLQAGSSYSSKTSIFGVSAATQARQQFADYLFAKSPRKRKLLSFYYPLGINGFPDHPSWSLDEEEMMESLDLLEKWQKAGVKFDYYTADVGWQDRTGDLTRFLPESFPDGPEKVIGRVNELGMNWGAWFAATFADWSCGSNPSVEPSRTVPPGGVWPEQNYRDGFAGLDMKRHLCLASEPYFSLLRDALVYHISEYGLKMFKLDMGAYFCNSVEHGHLPGKYSVEANYDAVIDLANAARDTDPDVFIMWYWGLKSPFFALYGDSVFDKRLWLEAASTGDCPALFFRDGVIVAQDQATWASDLIPSMNLDSLGVWITDTWWGNSMRKERWQEAAVMDLGRGSLMLQIWGDLSMFSASDVDFLAELQELARQNEMLLQKPRFMSGDPWNGDVYSYSYFDGPRGLIFTHNPSFIARKLEIELNESTGLRAPAGSQLQLKPLFPKEAQGVADNTADQFRAGERLVKWLRPFEIALWEIGPVDKPSSNTAVPSRAIPTVGPGVDSVRVSLEAIDEPGSEWEILFGERETMAMWDLYRSPMRRPSLAELNEMGYVKRILARRGRIPMTESPRNILAIRVKLSREGHHWRHRQLADLIQTRVVVGTQELRLEAVPNFRQVSNNQWVSWIVFKTKMSPDWLGLPLTFSINAYLPSDVNLSEEVWVVPEWWTPK